LEWAPRSRVDTSWQFSEAYKVIKSVVQPTYQSTYCWQQESAQKDGRFLTQNATVPIMVPRHCEMLAVIRSSTWFVVCGVCCGVLCGVLNGVWCVVMRVAVCCVLCVVCVVVCCVRALGTFCSRCLRGSSLPTFITAKCAAKT
jgi:hypothetical protein